MKFVYSLQLRFLVLSIRCLTPTLGQEGDHNLRLSPWGFGDLADGDLSKVKEASFFKGTKDLDDEASRDFPTTGLEPQRAFHFVLDRLKEKLSGVHEGRMSTMEDLSDKEIREICGTSASLECGKKVLKYTDPSTKAITTNYNIYRRCNLRKEFLDCIDQQRQSCRRESEKGLYPRLPPKSLIRSIQSKIWRALWTSGGCVLVN